MCLFKYLYLENIGKKLISLAILFCFLINTIFPSGKVYAEALLGLPEPGRMVSLSPAFEPPIIKGIKINADKPFQFDFIVDPGQDKLTGDRLKIEGKKLIKYFLVGLAIPEEEVWVNLSPYEKDRTIPDTLSHTEMGRDLLAQDYVLKQITASLTYPESNLGKLFWDRVYARAYERFGKSVNIPINTFNKVWIKADRAEIFEHNQTAFVVKAHLKVMLEEDYLASQKHQSQPGDMALALSPSSLPSKAGLSLKAPQGNPHSHESESARDLSSQVIREIILPELEKEVNQGQNFANLRQIFNSLILAAWYKKALKNALLNQVYANKDKIKGVSVSSEDQLLTSKIYERYLKAYRQGVFNFIKDDLVQGEHIPRKYFSGGVMGRIDFAMNNAPEALAVSIPSDRAMADITASVTTTPSEEVRNQPWPSGQKVRSKENKLIPVSEVRKYWRLTEVRFFPSGIRTSGLKWGQQGEDDEFKGRLIENDSYALGLTESGAKIKGQGRPEYIYVLKRDGIDDEIYAGSEDIKKTFHEGAEEFKEANEAKELLEINKEIVDKTNEIKQTVRINRSKVELMGRLVIRFQEQMPEAVEMYHMLVQDIYGVIPKIALAKIVGDEKVDSLYQGLIDLGLLAQDGTLNTTTEKLKKKEDLESLTADPELQKQVYEFLKGVLNGNQKYDKDGVRLGIGIGDATFETIKLVYDEFKKSWDEQIKSHISYLDDDQEIHTISFDDFMQAWMTLEAGYEILKKGKIIWGNGFLYNEQEINALIEMIEKWQKPEPIKDLNHFYQEVWILYTAYQVAMEHQLRLVNERLAIARDQRQGIDEDDFNRSSEMQALRLMAKVILERYKGKSPHIIVTDAQQGVFEKLLSLDSADDSRNFTVVDLVKNLRREEGIALEARIDHLGEDGKPLIHKVTPESELVTTGYPAKWDPEFKADVIVFGHNLARKKPKEVADAVKGLKRLIKNPNSDPQQAPMVLISLPENVHLSGSVLEEELVKQGFTAVEQGEGLHGDITPDTERGIQALLRRNNFNETDRQEYLRHAKSLVNKRFNYAAYVLTNQPTVDVDTITEIPIEKQKKVSEPTGLSNDFFSKVYWNELLTAALLAGYDMRGVEIKGSRKVFQRGAAELHEFEQNLSGLQWFLAHQDALSADFPLDETSANLLVEMRQKVLTPWDQKRVNHIRETVVQQFNARMNTIELSKSALDFLLNHTKDMWLTDIIAPLIMHQLEQSARPEGPYSLAEIYKAIVDFSQISETHGRQAKDRWASKVVMIMDQGRIPTDDLFFEGTDERTKTIQMMIWQKMMGDLSVSEMIRQTVTNTFKTMIIQTAQRLQAAELMPTMNAVATNLLKEGGYFRAWHEERLETNPDQTPLVSLEQWIVEFLEGKKDDLQVVEFPDWAWTSQTLKSKLQWAYTQLKALPNHRGLLADIDRVAAVLEEHDQDFQASLGEMKKEKAGITRTQALEQLVGFAQPKMSPEQIYDELDLFIPTPHIRQWEENKKRIPNRMSRMAMEADRKIGPRFEIGLAALIMLFEKVPKDQLPRLMDEKLTRPYGGIWGMRRQLAQIRYLWDTQKATYLTDKQIKFIISSLNIPLRVVNEIEGGITSNTAEGKDISLEKYFMNELLFALKPTTVDLNILRHQDNARLTALKSIILGRMYISQGAFTLRAQVDWVSNKVLHLLTPSTPLTLTHLSEALQQLKLELSPQGLKEWFLSDFVRSYGITMKSLGVIDDITPAVPSPKGPMGWAELERKMMDVVKSIEDNGTAQHGIGVMPDIDNVAFEMMKDAQFAAAVRVSRQGPKDYLLKQIKLSNIGITDYQILTRFRIFVPGVTPKISFKRPVVTMDALTEYIDINGTKYSVVSRQKIGSHPDLKNVEATITGVIWLMEKTSDEDLFKMLKSQKANRHLSDQIIRQRVQEMRWVAAQIRYAWDTLDANFLTVSQMDFLKSFITPETSIPWNDYPPIIRDEISRIAGADALPVPPAESQAGYSVENLSLYYFAKLANELSSDFQGARQEKVLRTQTGFRLSNILTLRKPQNRIGFTPRFIKPIEAVDYRLNFTNVAEYLSHFNDPLDAAGLKRWFADSYTSAAFYGIQEEDVKPIPLFDRQIKNYEIMMIKTAVHEVKSQGHGYMPDISRVSLMLYETKSGGFANYADSRKAAIMPLLTGENIYLRLVKKMYPGLSDDEYINKAWLTVAFVEFLKTINDGQEMTREELYNAYGVYMPSPEIFGWSSGRLRTASNLVKNEFITDLRKISPEQAQEFESLLTALFWFSEHVTEDYMKTMIPGIVIDDRVPNKDILKNFRMEIANIRFQWDSLNSFLSKSQIDFVFHFAKGVWMPIKRVSVVPESIMDGTRISPEVKGEEGKSTIDLMFIDALFAGVAPVDLNLLRPVQSRPLAVISTIVKHRNTLKMLKEKGQVITDLIATLDQPLLKMGAEGIFAPDVPLTFENVSAALNLYGVTFEGQPMNAERLEAWFNTPYIKANGYSPQYFGINEPLTPLLAFNQIRSVVETIKSGPSGAIPNLYTVASALYRSSRDFKVFVDQRQADVVSSVNADQFKWFNLNDPEVTIEEIKIRAARGELLREWINRFERESSGKELNADQIYLALGVYVPSLDDLSWNAQMPQKQTQSIITRQALRSDPKTNSFQAALTMAIFFYGHLDEKSALKMYKILTVHARGKTEKIRRKVFINENDFRTKKLLLARLQFLMDTLGAEYVEESQFSFLMDFFETSFEEETVPESIKKVEGYWEDFADERDRSISQATGKKVQFDNLAFRAIALFRDIVPKSKVASKRGRRDPFLARVETERRMARISFLIQLREMNIASVFNQKNRGIPVSKVLTDLQRLFSNGNKNGSISGPIWEIVNFDTLAQSLSLIGDELDGGQLRQWFTDNNIDRRLFGIYEPDEILGWENSSDIRQKAKLAVMFIKARDKGFVPDIDRVGQYMFDHDPKFRYWTEKERIAKGIEKYTPGMALLAQLELVDPELSTPKQINDLLDIYVPSQEIRTWKARQAKGVDMTRNKLTASKTYRSLKGIVYDAREFEARFTALIKYLDPLSEADLERMIPYAVLDVEGVNKEDFIRSLKMKIAEIRYIWDTLGANYLTREQIDFVFMATENLQIRSDKIFTNDAGGIKFRTAINFHLGSGAASKYYRIVDSYIVDFLKFRRLPAFLTGVTTIAADSEIFSSYRPLISQRLGILSSVILVRNDIFRRDSVESRGIARRWEDMTSRLTGGPPYKKFSELQVFDPTVGLNDYNVILFLRYIDDSTPEELDTWFKSPFVTGYGITRDFFGFINKAMKVPGGIDLNTKDMSMTISKEGPSVSLGVDQAMLKTIEKEGVENLTPVILKVTIIDSIWTMVGINHP